MAAWDRGLRAGKPLKNETLLAACAPGKDASGRRLAYAMGWELEYDDEDTVVTLSHSGSWEGFQTYVGHDLAREASPSSCSRTAAASKPRRSARRSA